MILPQDVARLTRHVHERLVEARPRILSRRRASLIEPGMTTDRVVAGIALADVLRPCVLLSHEDRVTALDVLPPLLTGSRLGRWAVTSIMQIVGKDLTRFIIMHKGVEARYAALLWALGHTNETTCELDQDRNTILVQDQGKVYGVRDGIIVGSAFAGTPMSLPLADLFQPTQKLDTASLPLIECEFALRSSPLPELQAAGHALLALNRRAKWDTRVLLRSSLTACRRKGKQPNASLIADAVMKAEDPRAPLRRHLLHSVLTPREFERVFGRGPANNRASDQSRQMLINKLYQLPFVQK